VALLVLSYQLRVLRYPERYAKTGTLMVKAPPFQALSNLRILYTVKPKYWEQWEHTGAQCVIAGHRSEVPALTSKGFRPVLSEQPSTTDSD
jgi:hypothetical protein